MKSEKKKILSGKECEVMNYLPYFKEPPIDVIKRYKTIKRYALSRIILQRTASPRYGYSSCFRAN